MFSLLNMFQREVKFKLLSQKVSSLAQPLAKEAILRNINFIHDYQVPPGLRFHTHHPVVERLVVPEGGWGGWTPPPKKKGSQLMIQKRIQVESKLTTWSCNFDHGSICAIEPTCRYELLDPVGVRIQYVKFVVNYLVVEPTHLKNMLVRMGSSSPIFGVKIPKNIWNHNLVLCLRET